MLAPEVQVVISSIYGVEFSKHYSILLAVTALFHLLCEGAEPQGDSEQEEKDTSNEIIALSWALAATTS